MMLERNCLKNLIQEINSFTLKDRELQFIQKDMEMIFQNFNLLNRLNVYENVALLFLKKILRKKEIIKEYMNY